MTRGLRISSLFLFIQISNNDIYCKNWRTSILGLFLYYGLSYSVGLISLSLYIYFYVKAGDQLLKNMVIFNANLFALIICESLRVLMPAENESLQSILWLLVLIVCSAATYTVPRFGNSTKIFDRAKIFNSVFLILSLISATLCIIFWLFLDINYISVYVFILMIIGIIYGMLIMLHPKIGKNISGMNKDDKKPGIITIVFVVLFYLIEVMPSTPFWEVSFPEYFSIFPAYYIILSLHLMSIVIKNFRNNKESISSLVLKYQISEREEEVINLLIKGLSYVEIGETLNISLSTVKSHISKIYKKTSTKNKIELISLLKVV